MAIAFAILGGVTAAGFLIGWAAGRRTTTVTVAAEQGDDAAPRLTSELRSLSGPSATSESSLPRKPRHRSFRRLPYARK